MDTGVTLTAVVVLLMSVSGCGRVGFSARDENLNQAAAELADAQAID